MTTKGPSYGALTSASPPPGPTPDPSLFLEPAGIAQVMGLHGGASVTLRLPQARADGGREGEAVLPRRLLAVTLLRGGGGCRGGCGVVLRAQDGGEGLAEPLSFRVGPSDGFARLVVARSAGCILKGSSGASNESFRGEGTFPSGGVVLAQ